MATAAPTSNVQLLNQPLLSAQDKNTSNASTAVSNMSGTSTPAQHTVDRLVATTIGCPRELYPKENRVAQSPDSVQMLTKAGFRVIVEKNAGQAANFPDEQYHAAGANVADAQAVWACDVILKVRAPQPSELPLIRTGQAIYSFVGPAQNKELVDKIAARKAYLFAMDCVPRITRAQTFDALSSMANIAGYKAVVLAADHFCRFFSGQMTAAGRVPPAKVLIIGGGVAGLSAIATAKNMGAIVRCFDTRPAVKEQVESLGGEFLEVKGLKLEEGQGGYAKEMSKEFIEAEMALFALQAKDVDVIITTALIPGKPAPRLITKEMVESMRYGSVVVDLASEMGGNIETTKKDELYVSANGVTHIGYTDLPSRLPTQSSRLYANNITKLMLSMTDKNTPNQLILDMEDEVTRGCIVLKSGEWMWPPPRLPGPPPAAAPKPALKKVEEKPIVKTFKAAVGVTVFCLAIMTVNLLTTSRSFLSMITTFALAGTAGYQAVWGVTPSLHTPLMAVTNAISGITAFGGLIILAESHSTPVSWWFSIIATVVSVINIFGGFLVTVRMLEMFRRPGDPNEHNYLYLIPGLCLPIAYILAKYGIGDDIDTMTYLASSLCCIGAIGGLASQKTSRFGTALGMIGVLTGLVCTVGVIGGSLAFNLKAMLVMSMGATVGLLIGRSVQVTELPQTVAAFHSLVGLAAMLSSVAHYALAGSMNAVTNPLASILGCLIGGITLTGSIVAFLKLHAVISSKALSLPGKNYINLAAVTLQALLIWKLLTTTNFATAMTVQYITMILSMLLGWHLVASVGGGDMPVCITVLNSYSGWALVAEGFMLQNSMLTVVGSLIGFSGGILSYIMCVAMNRSLLNVLFGGYAIVVKKGPSTKKDHRETTTDEVADLVANARSIIVVPGYGMAVSKAQHAVAELAKMCRAKNISFRFAIHPVAGRMPGQMNVLLAEAGVPYDWVHEMDEINEEFPEADVAIVCGANDITNSAATTDPDCAIAGMPVLHVWNAKQCIFMKRSMAAGYADMENPVFYNENTMMLLGDAKQTVENLYSKLKSYWEV